MDTKEDESWAENAQTLRGRVWKAFNFVDLLRACFCETMAIFSRSLLWREISKNRPFRCRIVSLPFAAAFNFFAHVLLSSSLFLRVFLFFFRLFDWTRTLRFTKHKAVETTSDETVRVKANAQRRSQPTNFTSNKWLWSAATVNLYEISWSMEII